MMDNEESKKATKEQLIRRLSLIDEEINDLTEFLGDKLYFEDSNSLHIRKEFIKDSREAIIKIVVKEYNKMNEAKNSFLKAEKRMLEIELKRKL